MQRERKKEIEIRMDGYFRKMKFNPIINLSVVRFDAVSCVYRPKTLTSIQKISLTTHTHTHTYMSHLAGHLCQSNAKKVLQELIFHLYDRAISVPSFASFFLLNDHPNSYVIYCRLSTSNHCQNLFHAFFIKNYCFF